MMKPSSTANRPRFFLVGAALLSIAMLVILFGCEGTDQEPTSAPVQITAPQPITPADGAEFVESDVVLAWEWTPALTADQQFAVRVWYEDQSPREVWTDQPALDVQEAIDSYEQGLGAFHWQVAVIVTGSDGGFVEMASAWSDVQTLVRVRHLSLTPVPAEDRSAAARLIMTDHYATTADLIDAARELVSTHSDITTEGNFAPDFSDALDMIAANVQGTGDPPGLLCNAQATALLTLLREVGIDSRLIFLYGDNLDKIQEHTLLEVFNPDTQNWELHDVLRNRTFVDEYRNRASIERIVFGPQDTILVCDPAGECAALPESNYQYRQYFEGFRYGHSDTFWLNPDRFNASKRFPTNGNRTLTEYLTGNSRDFQIRFDSWLEH